jgi:predicted RNA-binding Zn ribbon-like protein
VSSVDPQPPPHDLGLLIDYVNTLDVETGTDAIPDPAGLAAWLREQGLLSGGSSISAREYAEAIRLRSTLRALMRANDDHGEAPQGSWAEIEEFARRGELGVHFDAEGAVHVAPGRSGGAGALSRLLVPLAAALGDGSWKRVKACRAPDCEWAFYDRSRNRSGVWCDMAVCGNREKVRTYRGRG